MVQVMKYLKRWRFVSKVVCDNKILLRALGGDEFAAILPQLNDKKAIADIAERIIKSINTPFTIFDQQCSLGISIGIATSTSETQTSIKLKTQADQALYEAKNSGRNCYRFSK